MKTARRKIKKVAEILRRDGWRGFREFFRQRSAKKIEAENYQKWIRRFDTLTAENRQDIRLAIEKFSRKPLISVVLPVYNIEEKWLRLCIESVTNQLYENWELCIADDCSPSPHIRRVLEEYAATDKRIKIIFRETNGHISAASNSALELADGEFVALLDHDDELAEHALFYAAREINDFPAVDLIYSDEDLIDENGKRYAPHFKPDWSRDYFYSLNMITHLAVFRREILRKIGGFRIGYEGSQDYDLILRAIEQISEENIRHIPRILYHWRAIRGSVAFSSEEKPYAHERAREAIRSHFERTGKSAVVSKTVYNLHRASYNLPADLAKVSLIFSADDDFRLTQPAMSAFLRRTVYANLETVLICSEAQKTEFEASDFANNLKIIVSEDKSEAGKYNFAASRANGEILCFSNLNLLPETADWLKEMASFAFQEEIGAVGAKILDSAGRVLLGGLVIGAGEAPIAAAHRELPRDESGYFARAQVVNNFSAVSISCLAVRREVFLLANGFDAENFPETLFDADFCLKLREKNYRVVFTPYAELVQTGGDKPLDARKKPTGKEREFFERKWKNVIERDPFYNPNLSRRTADFSIDTRRSHDL